MASEYLMAVLKNNVGESSLPSIKEGDGPSSPPSFCPSSKNSSVGDFDDMDFHSMGLHSPNGPMRGRTVKEFEEQLSKLKKENFNLKLRIYFLEEKMGTNFTLDKDNIVKKNIELQVEIASLQKEVKERHELLCQAVKAMEIEQDEHHKYTQNREEQIAQLQQEMEDLRQQLQDMAFTSAKSDGSSRHSEIEHRYEFVPEPAPHRRYMDESDLSFKERRDQQLAHFVYDKTDSLRQQIDALQKECETKNRTVESLNTELASAKERLVDFAQQVKEYEENLAAQHLKNGNLLTKMQEDQKTIDKLKAQLAAINQKYSMAKYEFDHEIEESKEEKKSFERDNMMLQMRVSVLDNDNRKQKDAIRELQNKLEAALNEAKKNQNIAVSTSRAPQRSLSNTDARFISASDAATADGATQESPLHVQIKETGKGRSPTKSKGPPTPDSKNLQNFERLLMEGGDNETVRAEFVALKNDFALQKQKILKLKSEQLKACEIIKNMIDMRNKANEEITQLKTAKQALEKELENVVTKPQKEEGDGVIGRSQLHDTAVSTPPSETLDMTETKSLHDDADLEIVEGYKRLTNQLEVKIEVLVATLKEKDNQMEYLRSQYDEILNILEKKENKIVDLEFELLSMDHQKHDRSFGEKGDIGTEKRSSFYKQELQDKNREIEKLNGELKKCTCYLQEIVNTELWDKNRQIEKLQSKQDNTTEVMRLKKELTGKDSQLKLLKEKICELGLDIQLPDESFECKSLCSPKRNIEHIKALQDQLRAAKEERNYFQKRAAELETTEITLEKLRAENENVKAELDKSEKLRQEVSDICTILGNRLEELAIFLDSLLKQKSVLGFLGSAKNKRLREIINSSIDMSRSFTMSLMINPDQSLAQLTNITTLLNGSVFQELNATADVEWEAETHFSIQPDNISLTYDSHLSKKADGDRPDQEQVIAVLREQVFKLKEELQVRDNELNRLNQVGSDDQDKESGVERLRDGADELQDKSGLLATPKSSTATVKAHLNETHSESEAWSEPDRAVSRARMGLNRSMPVMGVAASRPDYCESTEEEDIHHSLTPSKRRSALLELSQEVYRLQKELDDKSEELVANGVMHRQQMQTLNRELQEGKEKMLQAELEKTDALKKSEDIQKAIDELTAEKHLYEENMKSKDKAMQDKVNQIEKEKQQLQLELTEAQNELQAKETGLKILEQHWQQKEIELRKQYEGNLIEKLKKAEEAFIKQLKSVQDKCQAEVSLAQDNLRLIQEEYSRDYVKKDEVQKKLLEAEYIAKELTDLKSVVSSYEQTLTSFKDKERIITEYEKSVVRLQLTNAQLEQDKLNLESQVTEMTELRNEIADVTRKYDEQVATLQKQKSGLELKISELESSNADLHNKLIKTQTTRFSLGLNATLPPNVGISKFYRRQYSEQNYSSEEAGDELRSFSLNRSHQRLPIAAETERAEANSSPDLGIESDQGRFSSLETNGNVHRPLLPTIELTESLSNLFDGQQDDSNIVNANPHCCQKFEEIAHENNELKRKLLRMKRALEETAAQLSLANQRKKQVEKTICKQIHKTSQVLRKAKANLDSGSESDVFHT